MNEKSRKQELYSTTKRPYHGNNTYQENTTVPCFSKLNAYRQTSFYCASQILRFLQVKGFSGDPASSRSVGAVFPAVLAHFVSLCLVLVILASFRTSFIIIIFVMLIGDQ